MQSSFFRTRFFLLIFLMSQMSAFAVPEVSFRIERDSQPLSQDGAIVDRDAITALVTYSIPIEPTPETLSQTQDTQEDRETTSLLIQLQRDRNERLSAYLYSPAETESRNRASRELRNKIKSLATGDENTGFSIRLIAGHFRPLLTGNHNQNLIALDWGWNAFWVHEFGHTSTHQAVDFLSQNFRHLDIPNSLIHEFSDWIREQEIHRG